MRKFANRRIKDKAAPIASAAAARGRSSVVKKGGKSGSYEDWTVDNLRKRAKSWAYRATPASTNPNWCPC